MTGTLEEWRAKARAALVAVEALENELAQKEAERDCYREALADPLLSRAMGHGHWRGGGIGGTCAACEAGSEWRRKHAEALKGEGHE